MTLYRDPYTLPRGKYKGQSLDRVPRGYLIWLHENADDLPVALHCAICRELHAYFSREAARLERTTLPADECPRCHARGLVELDLDTNMCICSACAATWRKEP